MCSTCKGIPFVLFYSMKGKRALGGLWAQLCLLVLYPHDSPRDLNHHPQVTILAYLDNVFFCNPPESHKMAFVDLEALFDSQAWIICCTNIYAKLTLGKQFSWSADVPLSSSGIVAIDTPIDSENFVQSHCQSATHTS